MEYVTVNLRDQLQGDNTTPAAPARGISKEWRTVVFAVEDFHYNSNPPASKIRAETDFRGLLFHGREAAGASGTFWVDKVVIYRGSDVRPPVPPTGMKAEAGPGGTVTLTWEEPPDDTFAVVYSIYRRKDGGSWHKIAETIPPRFTDTVPEAGRYGYRITAADYDNNCSPPSETALVSATGGMAAGPLSPQEADRLLYAENVRAIHAAGRGTVRQDVFLFAGDSITAADVYTYVLGGWLARGITVRQGVGQMRTDFGKARIGGYLTDHRPEFAVIMYGTNDAKDPASVKAAMENLASVIDACAKAGTVPILATIPPRGYDKGKQEGQVRFNEALVRLCHQKRVPMSYCFEEMMQRDLKQMLGDGVHLVPTTGNDAAGEALWRTFREIGFALRDTSGDWR
jgi:hypothetical protein